MNRRTNITNDAILKVFKETYLFDWQKVDGLLTELFFRYLNILDFINLNIGPNDPSVTELKDLFRKIEESRTILYFIGVIFCEEFGRGAIERRLSEFKINPLEFYQFIDQEQVINYLIYDKESQERLFEIIKFYLVLKKWKQVRLQEHRLYLAEDYFNHTKECLLQEFDKKGKAIRGQEWYFLKKM